MQTIEITGHIYAVKEPWETELRYTFYTFSPEYAGSNCIHVCPHKLVVELPDTFNPVTAEVEAIDREIDKVEAESGAHIKRLKDRKANLLCIEYTPAQEVAA